MSDILQVARFSPGAFVKVLSSSVCVYVCKRVAPKEHAGGGVWPRNSHPISPEQLSVFVYMYSLKIDLVQTLVSNVRVRRSFEVFRFELSNFSSFVYILYMDVDVCV